jgi:Cys-tRNA(Pro) deacylase
MSVESVKQFFIGKNLDFSLMALDNSGATVELAAKNIGVAPELIAKTLAFNVKEKNILIVTRGDARIDNKKFKQYFNTKAKMLSYEEVLQVTGHPVGGVCPFGLKEPLEVYMDISLKAFEYVYPAAGDIHAAMKISTKSMEELTNASWIDVCQSS